MNNPLKTLTKKDWILWGISLAVVVIFSILYGIISYRFRYWGER